MQGEQHIGCEYVHTAKKPFFAYYTLGKEVRANTRTFDANLLPTEQERKDKTCWIKSRSGEWKVKLSPYGNGPRFYGFIYGNGYRYPVIYTCLGFSVIADSCPLNLRRWAEKYGTVLAEALQK